MVSLGKGGSERGEQAKELKLVLWFPCWRGLGARRRVACEETGGEHMAVPAIPHAANCTDRAALACLAMLPSSNECRSTALFLQGAGAFERRRRELLELYINTPTGL